MATDQILRRSDAERKLYTWAAVTTALIVIVGFARTYYLKGVFGFPPLTGLVHLHGVIMTLWIALFIVQVRLVAARRTGWHRRLGVAGGLLAAAVLTVGTIVAIEAARLGRLPGSPLQFLVIPLGDLSLFAIFVGAGLLLRNRSAVHKRLMLLSCAAFLPAAVSRIPLAFIENGSAFVYFGLSDLCLLAWIAFDTIKHRRLHPAFGWGILLIIASQPFRLLLAETSIWMRFATWLVG